MKVSRQEGDVLPGQMKSILLQEVPGSCNLQLPGQDG